MKLVGTKKLRLSYLLNMGHCNTRPMYIENDSDLKTYFYFGCAKDKLVLYVKVECIVVSTFDSFETTPTADIFGTYLTPSFD